MTFQERHKQYKKKISELEDIQKALSREIEDETQLLVDIRSDVKRLSSVVELKLPDSRSSPPEHVADQLNNLREQIKDKERLLEEVRLWLPKKNAFMLNVHLGSIRASFLKKDEKFAYKEEYERFKYVFTIVSLVFAFTNLFIINSRSVV